MKQRFDKERHEMMRLSCNFQRGNTVQQRTELVKVLRMREAKEKANQIAEILYEAFGKDFEISKDEGYRRYHISNKDAVVHGLKEGQMVITVQPDASLIIRLNSLEGNVVYVKNKLSKDDFVAELDALKAFIQHGTTMPETSTLVSGKNSSD